MSSFGSDPLIYLSSLNLIESSRILEINSLKNFILFTVKKYSTITKTSSINLYLHNSITLNNKKLTRFNKGGISNPILVLDYNGVEDSALFLKNGQIWLLPLNGG